MLSPTIPKRFFDTEYYLNHVQEVRGGFTRGRITIAPLMADEIEGDSSAEDFRETDRLIIPFQNENLHAYVRGDDGSLKVRIE